jgi:hypothetical protein
MRALQVLYIGIRIITDLHPSPTHDGEVIEIGLSLPEHFQ